MSIRILLADNHRIFRDGLRSLLGQQAGLEVVAEAGDGHAVLELVEKHAPDVVVMDIGMPLLNGIEATRRISHSHPRVNIVMLSMHTDSMFVVRALKAGALGYVEKNCAFEELNRAIQSVMAKKVYLSSGITGPELQSFLSVPGVREYRPSRLTAREREVLQLQSEGKSTREIAELLHISVKTVETHRQHIMAKLNLHSTAELTKYALRTGLTTLGE